jgi:hypothetical protein
MRRVPATPGTMQRRPVSRAPPASAHPSACMLRTPRDGAQAWRGALAARRAAAALLDRAAARGVLAACGLPAALALPAAGHACAGGHQAPANASAPRMAVSAYGRALQLAAVTAWRAHVQARGRSCVPCPRAGPSLCPCGRRQPSAGM